jgi:5-methylcytosine-specific restriction enzyme subunit McrC
VSVLTLREHDTFAIGDCFSTDGKKSVTANQADALERLSRRLKAAGLKGDVFKHANRTTLKAQQFVGVMQLGTDAVEIIPKIDGLDESKSKINLLKMLARTRRLAIHEADLTRLAEQNLTILEIFIRLFCDKLFVEVHRGLVSRYERHSDNLPALRGKLMTGLQATLNAFHPERFRREFDEFTVDTPVNRVLKAAVRRLRRVTRNGDNARRLAELAFTLEGVTDVPTAALEWHRLHVDRANRRYEPLVAMARMILLNRTQDVTSGGLEGFGLVFDMNELFEEYIGEVARATFTPSGWQVVLQGPSLYLLQDRKSGTGAFQTRPDVTGLRNGRPVWIIDTKWKVVLDKQERKHKIGQGDVYQMLGYAHRYGVGDVYLLYPHHDLVGADAGLQRSFRIPGNVDSHAAEAGVQCVHVATIDLADLSKVSGQLKSILEKARDTRSDVDELVT